MTTSTGGPGNSGHFHMGKSFIRAALEVLAAVLFGLFVVSQLAGGSCRDGGSRCEQEQSHIGGVE